jgi:hypothetical protein
MVSVCASYAIQPHLPDLARPQLPQLDRIYSAGLLSRTLHVLPQGTSWWRD